MAILEPADGSVTIALTPKVRKYIENVTYQEFGKFLSKGRIRRIVDRMLELAVEAQPRMEAQ